MLLQWADDVVSASKCDQDVLKDIVRAEILHRLVLGAHDLGSARSGHFQVDTRTDLQHHAAAGVDQRGGP